MYHYANKELLLLFLQQNKGVIRIRISLVIVVVFYLPLFALFLLTNVFSVLRYTISYYPFSTLVFFSYIFDTFNNAMRSDMFHQMLLILG